MCVATDEMYSSQAPTMAAQPERSAESTAAVLDNAVASLVSGRIRVPVSSASIENDGIAYQIPVLKSQGMRCLPTFSTLGLAERFLEDDVAFLEPTLDDLCALLVRSDADAVVIDPGSDQAVMIESHYVLAMAQARDADL